MGYEGDGLHREVPMTQAIGAALSGARARQLQVEAAARNVANAATRGYRRVEPVFEEIPGGVGVRLRRVDEPGPPVSGVRVPAAVVGGSNVELSREIPRLIEGQRGFETHLKVLRTQDEMLGTLLDLKR